MRPAPLPSPIKVTSRTTTTLTDPPAPLRTPPPSPTLEIPPAPPAAFLQLTIRELVSDRWVELVVPREWRVARLKRDALEKLGYGEPDEASDERVRRVLNELSDSGKAGRRRSIKRVRPFICRNSEAVADLVAGRSRPQLRRPHRPQQLRARRTRSSRSRPSRPAPRASTRTVSHSTRIARTGARASSWPKRSLRVRATTPCDETGSTSSRARRGSSAQSLCAAALDITFPILRQKRRAATSTSRRSSGRSSSSLICSLYAVPSPSHCSES